LSLKLRRGPILRALFILAGLFLLGTSTGCHRDLRYQPRIDPLEKSRFFADGVGARPIPAGTVARGQLREDRTFYTGQDGEAFAASIPLPVDRALLDRGRERFNIYCAPCHGQTGDGLGMVVRRGYKQPPSFHIDRLRRAQPGYYFDVITNGFAKMPSYASQVQPADRWAIVAYIRALQLSQNATLEDVPAEVRRDLEAAPPAPESHEDAQSP
jgi:mono/diheme cytochrome c family protein